MGTTYSIKLVSLPPSINQEKLQNEIQSALNEIDHLMSTYLPSSELSRFNAYDRSDWFAVSPLTMRVIREALEVSQQSKGAFDLTVGKLVNIWGFGKDSGEKVPPSEQEIQEILKTIGYQRIEIDTNQNKIKKNDPSIVLDLSAVAKGFAVDEVANLLEGHQVANYLVEVGGEIRVNGTKQNEIPWVLAIEKPITTKRAIYKTLSIGQNGMATSGDYRNFFVKDGKRYSHVIDPETGYPIQHETGLVSVIQKSCATADAWATALLVLGKDKGYEIAVKNNLSVLFVYRSKGGFRERGTANFLKYTK